MSNGLCFDSLAPYLEAFAVAANPFPAENRLRRCNPDGFSARSPGCDAANAKTAEEEGLFRVSHTSL